MNMVGHKHLSMYRYFKLFGVFTKLISIGFNVFIADESRLAVITALNNVLGIIWNLNSWATWHGGSFLSYFNIEKDSTKRNFLGSRFNFALTQNILCLQYTFRRSLHLVV